MSLDSVVEAISSKVSGGSGIGATVNDETIRLADGQHKRLAVVPAFLVRENVVADGDNLESRSFRLEPANQIAPTKGPKWGPPLQDNNIRLPVNNLVNCASPA